MEGGRVRSGIAAEEEEGEAPAKKEDEVTLGEDDDLGEEEGDADPLDLGELIVLSNDWLRRRIDSDPPANPAGPAVPRSADVEDIFRLCWFR